MSFPVIIQNNAESALSKIAAKTGVSTEQVWNMGVAQIKVGGLTDIAIGVFMFILCIIVFIKRRDLDKEKTGIWLMPIVIFSVIGLCFLKTGVSSYYGAEGEYIKWLIYCVK